MQRREFLKHAGLAAAATAQLPAAESAVAIVIEPDDYLANRPQTKWAASELQNALKTRGVESRVLPRLTDARPEEKCVLVANQGGAAESMRLSNNLMAGRNVLQVGATDVRGMVYGLLELADRVRLYPAPMDAFVLAANISERPANQIRAMSRCFQSDVEDKGWFHDREMWREYLTMLATHRFNRFNLCFGLGYDFPRDVLDSYFYFAYPFLLDVPGFKVRASKLPDAERDRNLETLRFISDETATRGLHFQLGLWTHQYEFENSPNVNHKMEGLTPANHAAYCKAAVAQLLKACPSIAGLSLRVHGESGIAEGSYDFWKTLFEGITSVGRRVEIDMHAKGMDQKMIDTALATGLPVNISPKFWAEHMGMPYHQAAIRELEMPPKNETDHGVFALSNGSRKFLRYGYGDLLREDRKYGVLHRIWPGTQRMLLWGDPVFAAAYSRAGSFCGSLGVEWFEPLSFKGRKGSGRPGGRCGYADTSLNPKWDWQKYLYTYRVWGRCMYNPEADPEQWRRYTKKEFGEAAQAAARALSAASTILPIITTMYGPSASNNSYWPEMYTSMPIVDTGRKHPYSDTPSPKVFFNASPFDPQIFGPTGLSRLQGAAWLDEMSKVARRYLSEVKEAGSAEVRRWKLDIAIMAGIGAFFAEKFRASDDFASFENTKNRDYIERAIEHYERARQEWASLATLAAGAYARDVTYGLVPHLRGHWLNRLPEIDADIAEMKRRGGGERMTHGLDGTFVRFDHTPPHGFRRGEELRITASAPAEFYYRRVDQAEHWVSSQLEGSGKAWGATIPASYTNGVYALQYYFRRDGTIYPGFGPDLAGTPYHVINPIRG